ncbi:MAG: helix-turn-helix domain-containing protein [Acidobacteriia bacterium]|nr:helix-turn-helix domain-containing protein [Terriglobia bacterium]
MQDVSGELREFMAKRGLSQELLARRAGVSQSTVSRALRGGAVRHSRARHRLMSFARVAGPTLDTSTKGGISRVVEAFNEIWDGSTAHADAVARVIEAMVGLRPAGARRRKRR